MLTPDESCGTTRKRKLRFESIVDLFRYYKAYYHTAGFAYFCPACQGWHASNAEYGPNGERNIPIKLKDVRKKGVCKSIDTALLTVAA
jgi:hypothetical protein